MEGETVGSITREHVEPIFDDPEIIKHAPKTINSIVSSLTVPIIVSPFVNTVFYKSSVDFLLFFKLITYQLGHFYL